MDQIKNFITQINIIVSESNAIEKERGERGELFNIFEICGVNHYELAHSSIIAELLNTKGSHGQNSLYLNAFLETINNSYHNTINFAIDNISVETEKVIDNGRIDILISNAKKQAVIIENKIYASDQSGQLKRYAKYANDNYNEYHILYLSLDGHESYEATKDAVKYIPISYSKEIIDWLIKCKQLSIDKPLIRETLSQYIFHLKKLTKTDDNMNAKNKDELLNLLINNKNATIQIFKSERDLTIKLVTEYIIKELTDLATELDCKFKVDDDFEQRIYKSLSNCYSWPGFWFEDRHGWKVRFESQSRGLKNFICGLPTDYNPQIKAHLISCFKETSPMWLPGYDYLSDKYLNWDLETLFSIVENLADFRNYIKNYLEIVFNAIYEMNTASA